MNLGLPVTRPDPIVEGFIRFFQIRPGILLKTPKLSHVVVVAVDGAFVLPARHVVNSPKGCEVSIEVNNESSGLQGFNEIYVIYSVSIDIFILEPQ